MRALGLPGKSFVPMIVGFGCNVPAVMGARTLANPRERILTVMMMPFMSCGARLAIFSVFASAFFPKSGAGIIFVLYLIGILVAVLSGLVLRKTVLSGKPTPLVMELPPYHRPRLRDLLQHAWHRLSGFLLRAGKYIVPICVLIGVLNSISVTGHLVDEGNPKSVLAAIGRSVTPVFAPMGIQQDNWPATVGLATGVLAKEVVVGTLNSLYTSLAHESAQQDTFNFGGELKQAVVSIPENLSSLAAAFINPFQASEAPHDMTQTAYGEMYQRFAGTAGAFAYLLFVLLYFPCVSTMAAMRREVSTAWATFSMFWSTGLAYALAVIAFQLFTCAAHPFISAVWSSSMVLALAVAVVVMRYYAYRKANRADCDTENASGNAVC
jgi:ferrous iron transport protein B